MIKNSSVSEYEECKMFAQYLNLRKLKFTHIPNETRTPSMWQKMKNKMMWVSSWVPDYMIVVPKRDWNKLVFIEMKKKKWWTVSESQKSRLTALETTWCITCVCNWFNEAFSFMQNIVEN